MKLEKNFDQDHSNKYITTHKFNKLTSENFAAKLKQVNLASKSDIAKLVTKIEFDNKLKDVTLAKGLTKDLINMFSILHEAKYCKQSCWHMKQSWH